MPMNKSQLLKGIRDGYYGSFWSPFHVPQLSFCHTEHYECKIMGWIVFQESVFSSSSHVDGTVAVID